MNEQALHSLAYSSRAVPGMSSRAARHELHNDAMTRNAAFEITGLLIYVEGQFVQLLEGPRKRVLDLFQRIQTDSRHYDVSLIAESAVTKRAFDAWSMALCEFEEEAVDAQSQIRTAIAEARELGTLTPLTALESILLRMKRN